MKVLIVSDTHRRNENYFRVLELHPDAGAVIHCGDIEGTVIGPIEIDDISILPLDGAALNGSLGRRR